jgi:hypothetical protein
VLADAHRQLLARKDAAKEGSIADRRFKFNKRSQLFLCVPDESVTVTAMRVCNPDRSLVGINR